MDEVVLEQLGHFPQLVLVACHDRDVGPHFDGLDRDRFPDPRGAAGDEDMSILDDNWLV